MSPRAFVVAEACRLFDPSDPLLQRSQNSKQLFASSWPATQLTTKEERCLSRQVPWPRRAFFATDKALGELAVRSSYSWYFFSLKFKIPTLIQCNSDEFLVARHGSHRGAPVLLLHTSTAPCLSHSRDERYQLLLAPASDPISRDVQEQKRCHT